jgi:hypothetical protein
MNPESHRNIRDIAIDAKEAVSEVRKIVKAYDHMNEDYLTYLKKTDPDISAIEKSFQRKFSYFKEFLDMSINREVKTICKNKYPERDHIELFCEWVADGRIGKGEHVRHLDKIFSNSKARREFFRPDPIVDRISASESALGYINLPDLSKADVKVLAKAISQRLTSLDLDEIEEFNAFSECLEMVETVNTKLDTFARVQGNL